MEINKKKGKFRSPLGDKLKRQKGGVFILFSGHSNPGKTIKKNLFLTVNRHSKQICFIYLSPPSKM